MDSNELRPHGVAAPVSEPATLDYDEKDKKSSADIDVYGADKEPITDYVLDVEEAQATACVSRVDTVKAWSDRQRSRCYRRGTRRNREQA